jgi:beta-lactamase class A
MRTVLALLVAVSGFGQTLDSQIQAVIGGFDGAVSLYAKNLDTQAVYSLRGDAPVRTASTIKLAVMVEAFAEVQEGRIKWSDTLLLRDQDKVSGSGVMQELSGGVRLPVRDVMNLMIVVSDNTATNLLIDRFSADAVNKRMEALGFKQTRLMRKVRGDGTLLKPAEGWSEYGKRPESKRFGLGSTTPLEMVTLLEKLDRGEIVSAASSREMIELLKRQQDMTGMGRRIGALPIASKSGSLDALRSDVGIVYTPGGKVAMAITADDMKTIDNSVDNAGSTLIAELSKVLVAGLH